MVGRDYRGTVEMLGGDYKWRIRGITKKKKKTKIREKYLIFHSKWDPINRT